MKHGPAAMVERPLTAKDPRMARPLARAQATSADTPSRSRSASLRWPLGLRETVRLVAALGLIAAGVRFLRFTGYVFAGAGDQLARPEAADAFLPLGAMAALKVWLSTGYLDVLHPAAVVILIATLITAWLFRRAVCSWLCPFGAVSEYLAQFGRRMFGRNLAVPKWLDTSLVGAKHVGTFGMMLWLCLVPNDEILAFMAMPFYAVADVKLLDLYLKLGVAGTAVLAGIGVASVVVKSFWCRYLCPYGAVQGWLGALSPVRIVKDDASCPGCGICTRACPNGVDVARARSSVVSVECMGCTRCVTACPRVGAITLRAPGVRSLEPAAFGLAFVAAFVATILVGVVSGNWHSVLDAESYYQIYHTSAGVEMPWFSSAPEGSTP